MGVWRLLPALTLNLGALYLRDLAIDLPDQPIVVPTPPAPASAVPWVVRALPAAGEGTASESEGTWLVARAVRLLEYRGLSSAGIGCAWNPRACTDVAGAVRLSDAGHAALAEGFASGRVRARSRLEAELLAWSCLKASSRSGDATLVERCQPRVGKGQTDAAAALSPTGIAFGEYVDELNEATGARFSAALASKTMDCRAGLGFLRRWIARDEFRGTQLTASRSLSEACPDLAEVQFYRARAADLAGVPAEASGAYALSAPDQHPEPAFWQVDFLARQGSCDDARSRRAAFLRTWPQAADPFRASPGSTRLCASAASRPDESTPHGAARRVFGAETFPARFEDGAPMSADSIEADASASGGRARRAATFGAVLAYGPYLRLPYGRYRVSFFVKARGESLTGRVARLDVREDSDVWRPSVWRRTLRGRDVDVSTYRRFEHEFTSTGDGLFSIAVVSLATSAVYFDRLELERVERD